MGTSRVKSITYTLITEPSQSNVYRLKCLSSIVYHTQSNVKSLIVYHTNITIQQQHNITHHKKNTTQYHTYTIYHESKKTQYHNITSHKKKHNITIYQHI